MACCAAKDVLHVVQESWSHDRHMASRCKLPHNLISPAVIPIMDARCG